MPELRLNIVTKEWVIIAPGRASRPTDHAPAFGTTLPPFNPRCPFCPGNESMTPSELMRLDSPNSATTPAADHPGESAESSTNRSSWLTRVVDNMYPVLVQSTRNAVHSHDGLMHTVDGFGVHEVIIETPQHNSCLALLDQRQLEAIVRTYRDRYNACSRNPIVQHIVLFKNHGAGAGTSLEHPHAQIVGTPVVSHQVRDRIRALEEHLALYGECVLCRMVDEEIRQESRILHLSDSFVAFVPYAALSRYHIWIYPRRHSAHFGCVVDSELSDLASTLRTVLRQLHFGLGDPAFNFVVRSAPRNCTNEGFHWYLSIVPRIGQAAGFEFGSGIYVNTSYPEESAAFLRSVDTSDSR